MKKKKERARVDRLSLFIYLSIYRKLGWLLRPRREPSWLRVDDEESKPNGQVKDETLSELYARMGTMVY